MEALRRIRIQRKKTRNQDPSAYASWTAQEEAIHDKAFEIYERARLDPGHKLGEEVREAREPFCPPAIGEEPPRLGSALSEKVKASPDLFKGHGAAPWNKPQTPDMHPPPPMPAPWSAAPPTPDPTPRIEPAAAVERTVRRAVRKSKL